MTKNHRADTTPSTEAIIFGRDGEDCPIKLLRDYLSKMNQGLDSLWQKPNLCGYKKENGSWYSCQNVGINSVNGFMKKLSSYCGLSQDYTNHSVRSTAITILGTQFADTDVACFSGHRSLSALGIYKQVSASTKENMSNLISSQLSQQAAA